MSKPKAAGLGPAVGSGGRSHRRGGAGGFSRGAGAGLGTLARVVHLTVSIVVLIIVAGIFSVHSSRVALAVNGGLAAVVYLLIGGLVTRLLSSRR